ncbi:Flp pilus assembly protein TadG [Rhodospirillales bacterium URHD0017]|nr:Flp pilus assembly protein TadG [Rhodospirillales bacterium URHD0017]
MKHFKIAVLRTARDFCRDHRGAAAVLFAALIPAAVGVAGVTVDVGRAMVAKRALEASTQAAALAGAYALASPTASSSTVSTAITNWNTANPPSNLTITGSTPTLSCVTSTSNLPACSATSPNVVSLTQTASVSTFFLKALGRNSFTLSSTVKAAKAGGNAQSLNVMFVLDATGSMGDTDSNCTGVPGISSPSRFQCALYSMQSVLKVMPTSLDKVGLMIFPGMGSQYSPTSHPCSTQPSSVKWYTTNIKYQIHTALDNTYNDGAGSLVTTSPMVQAIGNYKTSGSLSPCVSNPGGQGSFAAEVIAKAQAAMPAVVTGTQNVIIFLSDGGFNADSSKFATGYSANATNQCKQAVTAAQAATAEGTKIYSVAYGASTATSGSDSCSTESGYTPKYTPCTAMQAIASDTGKFYSTNATCSIAGSPNPVTKLPDVFKAITTTLTKPRLITN